MRNFLPKRRKSAFQTPFSADYAVAVGKKHIYTAVGFFKVIAVSTLYYVCVVFYGERVHFGNIKGDTKSSLSTKAIYSPLAFARPVFLAAERPAFC